MHYKHYLKMSYFFYLIVTQCCYVPLDMRGGVKSCDLCGEYVIVLLQEGVIGLLQLKKQTKPNEPPDLQLSWPNLSQV